MTRPVLHRRVDVPGPGSSVVDTAYREAGPDGAPVVLLPHGYPASSFEFRNLMPALADGWRLVAPDAPGFGWTPAPAGFDWTFAAFADWLEAFTETLGLDRYVVWLHDYGSQFGLELALRHPDRVAGLIVQNGDVYEDQHGPKYATLKEFWADPTPEGRAGLLANVTEEGFRDEFAGDLPDRLAERVAPELATLHWALARDHREDFVRLFEDQANTLPRFAVQQAYLAEHRPPTLVLWGPHDGYMPEGAGRAYLRDLPDAELHVLDGGHWLLETNLDEVVPLVRDFLSRL